MNLKTTTDEALIMALHEKDLEALEELYVRHHGMAMAVAYRVLSDRNLAEDVLQEAFLAVWRQSQSFRPDRGSARSWILSIVRHRAIDITRGKAFNRETLSTEQVGLESRHPDAWQDVKISLDKQQIQEAIDGLPEEQRTAIMMAYFEGYNQREISERIGVPLGTVKGRLRLGMQKLKGRLTGTEVGEDD